MTSKATPKTRRTMLHRESYIVLALLALLLLAVPTWRLAARARNDSRYLTAANLLATMQFVAVGAALSHGTERTAATGKARSKLLWVSVACASVVILPWLLRIRPIQPSQDHQLFTNALLPAIVAILTPYLPHTALPRGAAVLLGYSLSLLSLRKEGLVDSASEPMADGRDPVYRTQ